MNNHWELKDWLFCLENRHQQEIQLGLARIREVAQNMALLQPDATVISVAGTNGKGSTVATLEAIYTTAGFQVGSYTSPHLLHFNERIRINHVSISDADLCQAFAAIEAGRGAIALTYFEMATLAALWHFKQFALDLIILEVGLGGRLDATNIVSADLAIITTIDFDHQDYLGNTLNAIGFEKAGILRSGKPCIYADHNPPASITSEAERIGAICSYLGKEYHYRIEDAQLSLFFEGRETLLPKPSLHPNSVTAAVVASLLLQKQLPVLPNHLIRAMQALYLPGRLEVIRGRVTTLFDVAHNPQAASYLAHFINNYPKTGRVHAVFSALKDKDIPGLIAPLRDCIDYWYPALLNTQRAASQAQLRGAFNLYNLDPICYTSPFSAYQSAEIKAKSGDLIVVYGSFVTVGEVLQQVTLVDKLPV
ncbi:MAG: bifunctional tetrahydrofolate synthase/dihydrofolate synthase [Tatlockia sp.]